MVTFDHKKRKKYYIHYKYINFIFRTFKIFLHCDIIFRTIELILPIFHYCYLLIVITEKGKILNSKIFVQKNIYYNINYISQ